MSSRAPTIARTLPHSPAWFEGFFGTPESSYEHVKKTFLFNAEEGTIAAPNGQTFSTGDFSCPLVSELRAAAQEARLCKGPYKPNLINVVHTATSGVMTLHAEEGSANATFQVCVH